MKKAIFFLLVSQLYSASVTIPWHSSIPMDGFNVYRATGDCTGTPVFVRINSSPVTVNQYVDTVVAGTFAYVVRGILNGAESLPSNCRSIIVLPPPPTLDPIIVGFIWSDGTCRSYPSGYHLVDLVDPKPDTIWYRGVRKGQAPNESIGCILPKKA